jgi:sepiapterin reductase
MANSIDLNGKLAYLLITGASKSIGARLSIEISKKLRAGSVIVLLARNLNGLEDTRSQILQQNANLNVIIKSIDLTKPSVEECDEIAKETFDFSVKFDLAMIVHNVGTIGDTSKWSREIDSYSELESYFSVNVFAPSVLNNRLLKVIPKSLKIFIVNITSKAAIDPFKSFGFYCMGKAAREMFFRVLAEEERDILVLNYSPGPVETDMTVDIEKNSVSEETSTMFRNLREQKTILTTEQTTRRFLEIVAMGNYQSGEHVDFFD